MPDSPTQSLAQMNLQNQRLVGSKFTLITDTPGGYTQVLACASKYRYEHRPRARAVRGFKAALRGGVMSKTQQGPSYDESMSTLACRFVCANQSRPGHLLRVAVFLWLTWRVAR